MKNLIKSNAIVLRVMANTPEEGARPARLLSTSGLDIKLIMKAKADFSN